MARASVLTFDCYGTLVDWEAGIANAFLRAARADAVELDRTRVLEAYARAEPLVQQRTFRPYREVLALTAVEVARQLGWSVTPQQATFLPESLATWPPFSDTNPALERLVGAGFTLGILSNVDPDLLSATLGQLSVPFDFTVTAEDVRSYKPAHAHFLEARRIVGDRWWMHVAQSYFHDIVPATSLGISAVWVNRKAERPTGAARARHDVADLTALAEWLEA
ncbi:MAG: HAD hydrolase-like protein [Gemmatimonadota bacterium]|nr:HAD hydrolase-like protein [Gemmatimonadota bacterium]MDH3368296.1 HAD hydrolase-like protein [Gemmatimonadota bacterium]MDH3478242.1 HAD hydrolase-like protein [Gemmatimonadota bacterium]MDH3571577.1 HAD hydrolase-like protein [Gemmatimonadota bacterium]MDH5551531.1 HAD hydrolase-like protein [Gemmatimonadota bacterium]